MKIDHIDLKTLNTFVKVSELGSFSQAAVALHKTPVAIRRHVSVLERQSVEPLFQRSSRKLELTVHGQKILSAVKKVIHDFGSLESEMLSAGTKPTIVRVGLLRSLCKPLGSRLASEVRSSFSNIRLQIFSGSTSLLEDRLARGDLDMAVLFDNGTQQTGSVKQVGTIRHYLIGPTGNALTAKPKVRFAELNDLPLILPNPAHGLRICLDKMAKKHRIRLSIPIEVNSLPLARPIIKGGGYYSVLSECAVKWSLKRDEFQAALIVEPEVKRTLALMIRARGHALPAARDLLLVMKRLIESNSVT